MNLLAYFVEGRQRTRENSSLFLTPICHCGRKDRLADDSLCVSQSQPRGCRLASRWKAENLDRLWRIGVSQIHPDPVCRIGMGMPV